MSRHKKSAPGAAATASEGLESVTHQEEESMSNFTPTAAEIVEAAIARNFGTLTLGQAEAIRREQRFNQSNMYVITPDKASPPDRMSPPDIPSPPDRMCLAHALITASDLLSQHGGR